MTSRTLPENILWNNQCSTDGNHNNLDPCHSFGPIWLNRMTNYYCNTTVETLWLKCISHQQELVLLLVALKNSKWTPLCRTMLLNDTICNTQYPTKCWVCARSTMKIRKNMSLTFLSSFAFFRILFLSVFLIRIILFPFPLNHVIFLESAWCAAFIWYQYLRRVCDFRTFWIFLQISQGIFCICMKCVLNAKFNWPKTEQPNVWI